jgi:ankyrin repeat protein
MKSSEDPLWRDALSGLERGDFSRLAPLFDQPPSPGGDKCRIIEWTEQGYFDNQPEALGEAFTCACFLGRTEVADFLLNRGVDPAAGIDTGLAGFHWAANRGNLDTVKLLIGRKAALEQENMYGGTVLACAVWSAIHEPSADHPPIIEALIAAGAKIGAIDPADYPTGNKRIDEALRRHGVGSQNS